MEDLNLCIDFYADLATILAALLAIIGGCFAFIEYKANNKLRRAEFYKHLFEMMFNDNTYLAIRDKLDPGKEIDEEFINSLESEFKKDPKLENELVNYLNYFEYILVLQKEIRIIKKNDVDRLLGYYLKQLSKNRYILDYVEKNGFEYLTIKLKNINGK